MKTTINYLFAILICVSFFSITPVAAQSSKNAKFVSDMLLEKLGDEVNEKISLTPDASEKILSQLNTMISRFAQHEGGKVLFHLEKITSIQSVSINNPGADINIIASGMVGGIETKIGIDFDFQDMENHIEPTFWFTDAGLGERMLFSFKEDKHVDDYEDATVKRTDGHLAIICLMPVDNEDYRLPVELTTIIDVLASK